MSFVWFWGAGGDLYDGFGGCWNGGFGIGGAGFFWGVLGIVLWSFGCNCQVLELGWFGLGGSGSFWGVSGMRGVILGLPEGYFGV